MKKPEVTIDKESWQAGYDAGMRGEPNQPQGVDVLSWHNGYIEGSAVTDKPKPQDIKKC